MRVDGPTQDAGERVAEGYDHLAANYAFKRPLSFKKIKKYFAKIKKK